MIRNRITFAVEVYEACAGVYERMGEFKKAQADREEAGRLGRNAGT